MTTHCKPFNELERHEVRGGGILRSLPPRMECPTILKIYTLYVHLTDIVRTVCIHVESIIVKNFRVFYMY